MTDHYEGSYSIVAINNDWHLMYFEPYGTTGELVSIHTSLRDARKTLHEIKGIDVRDCNCDLVKIKHPILGIVFDVFNRYVWSADLFGQIIGKKLHDKLVCEHIARNCDKYH